MTRKDNTISRFMQVITERFIFMRTLNFYGSFL